MRSDGFDSLLCFSKHKSNIYLYSAKAGIPCREDKYVTDFNRIAYHVFHSSPYRVLKLGENLVPLEPFLYPKTPGGQGLYSHQTKGKARLLLSKLELIHI